MSPTAVNNYRALVALATCLLLVKDAIYTDAAPSITPSEMTASKTVLDYSRVLESKEGETEIESEIEDPEKSAFENFLQGISNIDTAMEAMIDNYTDGVEHLGNENGLDQENSIFDKLINDKNKPLTKIVRSIIEANDDPAATVQIETPQVDEPRTSTDHDMKAKGPLSGIVPGGGGGGAESTTAASSTTSGGSGPGSLVPSGLPFGGGLPGLPGGETGGGGGGDGTPTLILGGFSILVVPVRGSSVANMASMLSAGQQLGQMLPKPV